MGGLQKGFLGFIGIQGLLRVFRGFRTGSYRVLQGLCKPQQLPVPGNPETLNPEPLRIV